MGIDIAAYRNLKRIDCKLDEEGEIVDEKILELVEDGDYIQPYKNPDFPGRADEIIDRDVYLYEDRTSCASYGYGRYNGLRGKLAEIAGYPLEKYGVPGSERESHCVACWIGKTGPFSELINFSDCEGVIGCDVSKKLFKDFEEFQTKADATNDDYFLTFYNSMKSAFEIASNDGMVDFH